MSRGNTLPDTDHGALDEAQAQPSHADILREVRDMRRESARWRREVFGPLADTVQGMRSELTKNTEVTTEVRDAATAAKWVRRLILWVAPVVVALVTLWATFRGSSGGGVGPAP